jgi:hypothetical protein
VTAIHTGLAILLSVCAYLLLLTAHFGDTQTYQVVKGVNDSYDVLIDLLESIEHFLHRLDIYTKIPPTVGMTEMVFKILVELLSTLAVVTKQINARKVKRVRVRWDII